MRNRVSEFHKKFGHPAPDQFHIPHPSDVRFRSKLINEEACEVSAELKQLRLMLEANVTKSKLKKQVAKVLAEACDTLYVVNGLFVVFGVDPEPYFEEIHRANMDKEHNPNGGKPLKPEGWQPADLLHILLREESGTVKPGSVFAREDGYHQYQAPYGVIKCRHCASCGMIQPADVNAPRGPCKGPAKIGPR